MRACAVKQLRNININLDRDYSH